MQQNTFPSSLLLQPRDVAMIKMAYDYNGVTYQLLRRRFYPNTEGGRVSCVVRIGQLVKAGYLDTRRIPWQLGVPGARALVLPGVLGRATLAQTQGVRPGDLTRTSKIQAPLTMLHHLEICAFRLSVELAVRSGDFELSAWTRDDELRHRPILVRDPFRLGQEVPIVPDGAFVLTLPDGAEQPFLLELDRGTVPPKRLKPKLGYYLAGGLGPVLFVVPTDERKLALARWTQEVALRLSRDPTIVWLATAAEVRDDTFFAAPIWHIAGGPTHVAMRELAYRPGRSPTVGIASPATTVQGALFS